MNRFILIALSFAFSLFMLAGCGGGGGDEGSTVGNLSGTWFGVVEDTAADLHTLSLQVDGAGNIVEITIDNTATGCTGIINDDWDEHLFHVLIDAGCILSGAKMIVDDSYRYAVFVDWNLYTGALEKGAGGLPAYQSDDIVGSYSGGAYEFVNAGSFWNWEGETISLTVDANHDFTGTSASGAISGAFNPQLLNPTYGGYSGNVDVLSYNNMDMKAFMSPDKNFVAAYAWDSTLTTITMDDYILIGLKR